MNVCKYCGIAIAWMKDDDKWIPWEMDELGNSMRLHKCTKSPYMSKGAKRQRQKAYIDEHPEIAVGARVRAYARGLDKEFSKTLETP